MVRIKDYGLDIIFLLKVVFLLVILTLCLFAKMKF